MPHFLKDFLPHPRREQTHAAPQAVEPVEPAKSLEDAAVIPTIPEADESAPEPVPAADVVALGLLPSIL